MEEYTVRDSRRASSPGCSAGGGRKYDTFRGKQAVLFINLLGKGLTQEINGDGGSI